MIKSAILKLLGETTVGKLDYLLKRKSKESWGPLNGQKIRQAVYTEILELFDFSAIVETGTYLGTTTDYFAQSGLPVYTVEIDPRAFGFAKQRFKHRRNQVRVFMGNSPEFLNRIASQADFPKSKVFFYLDAHVQDVNYHKAPLVEELEIIFSNFTEAVVLIDDFHIPGTNYTFDDWGQDSGKNLSLECFDSLTAYRLRSYFPVPDAEEETGARRGWVVVCKEDSVANALDGIEMLRLAAMPCKH